MNRSTTPDPAPHARRPPVPEAETPGLSDLLQTARALHQGALGTTAGSPSPAKSRPTITCLVLTGDLCAFAPDRDTAFDLVEAPCAESGWRSQCDIRNASGHRISVELISARSAPAAAPGPDPQIPPGFAAHRAGALQSIGEADRRLARTERDLAADRAIPELPTGPCGTVDLLWLSDLLDRVEARRLAGSGRAPRRRVRRMHGFAGPQPPGPCELVLALWSGQDALYRTTSVRSHLRRSEGAEILAVCETLYRS